MPTTPTRSPSEAMAETAVDPFPISGTDYVEFWVGNAKQAAYFYSALLGFELQAYRGPETGHPGSVSYLLTQGKIRILLTTSLTTDGRIAEHVARHGDGVRDLALTVPNASYAFDTAVERGAVPVASPETRSDDAGSVTVATIRTYGDTVHTFVERDAYEGIFMPGFEATEARGEVKPVGLKYVDHCVGNVELGAMDVWVEFYQRVMGFENILSFDDEDISTEYSALMSKVMSNGNGRIKFPINEPAPGKRKSQVDEYLESYGGPGVQHLALATGDILATVSELQRRGLRFLQVPTTYYDELQDRVGVIDEPLDELAELGILVDRDPDGYLLQIFTEPVQDRPTLFFEIIQRKGAKGFGKGNFKALFVALEQAQALRGNL